MFLNQILFWVGNYYLCLIFVGKMLFKLIRGKKKSVLRPNLGWENVIHSFWELHIRPRIGSHGTTPRKEEININKYYREQ